jgi:hypothetical protein
MKEIMGTEFLDLMRTELQSERQILHTDGMKVISPKILKS